MTSSQALVVGLALAATSTVAFVVPGPAHFRGHPLVEPGECSVGSARGGQVCRSTSTSFSFGGISNFFGGSNEKTCLPQDPEADTAGRKEELELKKKDYGWNFTEIPAGTPYLTGLPQDELPSLSWITKIVPEVIRVIFGTTRGTIGEGEVFEALTNPSKLKTFIATVSEFFQNTDQDQRPQDIDDYEDLHAFPIKTPRSVYDWDDDDAFARRRLQGANPIVIEKCTRAHRAKLKILDTDRSYKELRNKVDSLMKAGKLFVVDHVLLEDMEAGKLNGAIERHLAAGIALFEVVDDDLLPIRPLGIQLTQGDTASPIFTPEDPEYTWKIAKACFEAGDQIIHQMVSHLGYTHLVLEGVVVALNRCLPKAHPIHKLITPHIDGTALINFGAQEVLIVTGGPVDNIQANKIEDSWKLVTTKVLERIKSDFSPPEDFASRQTTAKDFPGRYMYRDVGLMYWEAIHTWVREYLEIYYKSDADIKGDYELKEFMDEIVSLGEVKWLDGFYSSSDKRALLAKVLASYIFSASVHHAGINFPQQPSTSFVPSSPGSVYVAPPTDKAPRTFDEFMAYLPPLEVSKEQVTVFTLLGSVFYTELGEYGARHFSDDRVKEPLEKFQEGVEAIGEELSDMNAYLVKAWKERGKDKKKAENFAYKTLLPQKIPQSINI